MGKRSYRSAVDNVDRLPHPREQMADSHWSHPDFVCVDGDNPSGAHLAGLLRQQTHFGGLVVGGVGVVDQG